MLVFNPKYRLRFFEEEFTSWQKNRVMDWLMEAYTAYDTHPACQTPKHDDDYDSDNSDGSDFNYFKDADGFQKEIQVYLNGDSPPLKNETVLQWWKVR